MSTVLERNLLGTPYHEGDPIRLGDAEAVVLEVNRATAPQPFGRNWCITAISYGVPRTVYVDDNGWNRTIGRCVRPSDRVEE